MQALVVDDSRSMRSMLARILRDIGLDVAEAGDGRSALEWLRTGHRADVALVDWHMPDMDGIELVSAIRSNPEWRSMAVMMVSAESDSEHIAEALRAGANEYMMKPFTAEAVSEKLGLLGITAYPSVSDLTKDS